MTEVRWQRFPLIVGSLHAKRWLTIQLNLGLAPNTVEAYGRSIEEYLSFCLGRKIEADIASREHIAAFVRALATRPHPRSTQLRRLRPSVSPVGLANATLQQRLTALRLYYDYLIEEGLRSDNPVGRGRYTARKGFGGYRERALIPHYHKLPWIPTDEEWLAVLGSARDEPIRNRLMLALSYDGGLRREELCMLQIGDIDPAHRLLRIRAETTKNRQERVVPYSEPTSLLYSTYLQHRRELTRSRGLLFLSESRRNRCQPITIWTWSKVIEAIAVRSGVHQLTTHTMRHLSLTDLARAGWDIHEIATFAGHRSTQTTLLYIHLSGRELAAKFERSMASLHAWRIQMMEECWRD
jgi:integrase/recombinase XerD